MMEEVFSAVAAALARGERAALVTIVRANGSTPQRVGAKMLVYKDGRTVGTIGGGCYENDAAQKARGAIDRGTPELVRYDLNDDLAQETGLICGGQMDVFIEPVVSAPKVFVFGAGHVGYQVARLASLVGFQVHIVDDREKFVNAERFPEPVSFAVEHIPTWIAGHPLPPDAYCVIVTRGHRDDLEALRGVVQQPLKYLGLIGSRAKVARLFEALGEEGVESGNLRRVHAPIGLDIGAVTPEEIAVAIVAELIAVRYGRIDAGAEAPAQSVRTSKWTPADVTASARH